MALNRRGGAPRNRTGAQLAQKMTYAATRKDATGCRLMNDPMDARGCVVGGWGTGVVAASNSETTRRYGQSAAEIVMIRLLSMGG